MELNEKDVKKISVMLLVTLLGVLVFFIIRPVLLSIIAGLILAYIFYPVYKKIAKIVKYETLAAALVSVFVLVLIFVPVWFLAPVMIKQVFSIFQLSQNFDVTGTVSKLFPQGSEQLVNQLSLTLNSTITKISSAVLNSIVDFLINFAIVLLHLVLVAFVFFFALRDEAKLREFASGISPINKVQEKALIKQFKDITQSIIYGQIILGLLQGILAGIGFLVFGVPNALILAVLAAIFGIIPVIGPSLVYIPATVYLLIFSSPVLAIGFLLYNVLIVSSVDNVLRSHLVARKTQVSQVIVLIGMVGGLLIFGVLGLILGPLVLAYFLTFLKAYKEKRLSSLFAP